MTEPTLDTLTQRLDRMEREVRWWRKIGGAGALTAVVLAGLLGATGASNPRELRAERLVITDKAGKDRALVFVDNMNDSHLTLIGNDGGDGGARVDLVAREAFSGASLSVSNGSQRGELSVAGNAAQLVLTDADWSSYLIATFGASSLILGKPSKGDTENALALFGSNFRSGSSLELRDSGGRKRVQLQALRYPVPTGVKDVQLLLFGRDGKLDWKAP